MMETIKKLDELIETGERLAPLGGQIFDGYNSDFQTHYLAWRLEAISVIEELGKPVKPLLKDLEQDDKGPYFYKSSASTVLGSLKAARAIALRRASEIGAAQSASLSLGETDQTKVFLVHGHDEAIREGAARFLEQQGLKAVILHEQVNAGKTVIEKLEHNSNVGYAIVLLTPDDEGKNRLEQTLQSRARQNVILELGYFIGKLGRHRVCALYKGTIEIPSDYLGVVYIPFDDSDGWKFRVAKELRNAGFAIDMNKI